MSDFLFQWYIDTKKLINRASASKEATESDELKEQITEWKAAIETMEAGCPELKEQYERLRTNQKSFTYHQVDFICYQIGDWYLKWENKMWVDGKPNQHWLGYAKEELKTMICGEGGDD